MIEIFHNDQGSEFDNLKIDMLLDVFCITRSPSRENNPYDNAVIESANRLVKRNSSTDNTTPRSISYEPDSTPI
ncbi:hypothetical protein [Bifidobacterium aquikefiri]|uniref:hypothetical protein n=1 Tax=Bifidobacterium aquikefiri TaxID=1653207 RepID=UPI0039EB6868